MSAAKHAAVFVWRALEPLIAFLLFCILVMAVLIYITVRDVRTEIKLESARLGTAEARIQALEARDAVSPDDAETLRKIIEQARPILEELERRSNDG